VDPLAKEMPLAFAANAVGAGPWTHELSYACAREGLLRIPPYLSPV
jgi:hypothetical protein